MSYKIEKNGPPTLLMDGKSFSSLLCRSSESSSLVSLRNTIAAQRRLSVGVYGVFTESRVPRDEGRDECRTTNDSL